MNEKFYELPQDKQQRIINSGLKIFGKFEYKRASTDEIAADAGISKGLLFYYFHNKKEFYQFLYDYSLSMVTKLVVDKGYKNITDFFELLKYCAEKKYEILTVNPSLMDFMMKFYYSKYEDVSDENNAKITDFTSNLMKEYLSNIDFSKFKDCIDPNRIMNMLYYLADGYLQDLQRRGLPTNMDELMNEFNIYCDMIKQISYKEEYL